MRRSVGAFREKLVAAHRNTLEHGDPLASAVGEFVAPLGNTTRPAGQWRLSYRQEVF